MKTKWCHSCKKTKAINSFCKNKSHKDGLGSMCRPCVKIYNKAYNKKNADKLKEYNKQWKKKNTDKEYNRRRKLKHKYGITLEQHKQMYVNQDGCCAICNMPVEYSKTHTDHDHKTGKVRGILCRRCNYGMAFIDDKEFVKQAKKYLKG